MHYGGVQDSQSQTCSEYGAAKSLQKKMNYLVSRKTEGSNLVKSDGSILTMRAGQRAWRNIWHALLRSTGLYF